MFLGNFHELGSVWRSMVGGVMDLVEDSVVGTLELPRGGVFKPSVCASWLEAEYTGGGIGSVQFGLENSRLLHGNMTAKNVEM